jgi:hypothetical protein
MEAGGSCLLVDIGAELLDLGGLFHHLCDAFSAKLANTTKKQQKTRSAEPINLTAGHSKIVRLFIRKPSTTPAVNHNTSINATYFVL